MPQARYLDDSMAYLERTKLQEAVSKALVQVVNERPGEKQHGENATKVAVRRMIELLKKSHAPDPSPASIAPAPAAASPDDVLARKKVEQKVKDLESRNGELWAENQRLKAAMDGSKTEIEGLERHNTRLLERVDALKEQCAQFRTQMQAHERRNEASTSSSPAPPARKAAPPAKKRPALSDELRGLLDKVFALLLDAGGMGEATSTRILALVRAFEQSTESGKEHDAMLALAALLRVMAEEHKSWRKAEWSDFTLHRFGPDGHPWPPPDQQQIICAILSETFKQSGSVEGLKAQVAKHEEELSGMRGFHDMMYNLAHKVLIPPGTNTRHIHRSRIQELIGLFEQGQQDVEDDAERNAMRAFVRQLERMASQKVFWTADEWSEFTPPRESFTPDEQDLFVLSLTTVLGSKPAVAGLHNALRKVGLQEAITETRRADAK